MQKLTLNDLKSIAKSRGIKGYKSMSKERLTSSINESESVNFDGTRIERVRKDFNESDFLSQK